jgi:hypothetical protein
MHIEKGVVPCTKERVDKMYEHMCMFTSLESQRLHRFPSYEAAGKALHTNTCFNASGGAARLPRRAAMALARATA